MRAYGDEARQGSQLGADAKSSSRTRDGLPLVGCTLGSCTRGVESGVKEREEERERVERQRGHAGMERERKKRTLLRPFPELQCSGTAPSAHHYVRV